MKKFILCFLMLLATNSLVWAEAVSFEAAVNSPRVSLDETMQLTLTVTGVNNDLDPVSLPVINGFSAKYLGPSTSVSIVNGDYHSERSFIYNLFPNKVGRFQIPPISATIAGQTYTTKPINVEVFQDSAQEQASAAVSDQEQGPTAESLKDKIMVKVSIDKTDVYLNERIPITIKLLVKDVPVRDIQFPQFDKQGLSVDEFDKPEQNTQIVGGVSYDAVEFKTSIYPNHLGNLTLGPVQIQGNVLYKNGQNNPFNQDNNPFGADVFNNFFDTYATRPITVSSDPVQLHVSALPAENRPNDFSGAIGEFDFKASVAPLQVKAGDPLTLKMDIKGSGNFKNLRIPVLKTSGFKFYEPKIKSTSFEKTAEEVIIPISDQISQVPALSFSYFDTSINDYKTITQGPFAIQVTSPSPDQEFKAVGFADVSRESAASPSHQFSLGKMIGQVFQILKKLSASVWFWLSLGGVFASAIFYFIWRRFQDRLENDPAFARRLKAVREAKQALIPAEGYITAGKSKDFYALLSRVLREYLANKWHQSSAALSIEEIMNHLKISKIDEAHLLQIKAILEECDLVCFAGANVDPAQMRVNLTQTQELIARLEKSLK